MNNEPQPDKEKIYLINRQIALSALQQTVKHPNQLQFDFKEEEDLSKSNNKDTHG